MSSRPRVALLGFSASERNRLESLLTLAPLDKPAYLLVKELAAADFCVVDADDALAMHDVAEQGRIAQVVLVGSPQALRMAPTGALAHVLRPLDPQHVMRELDAVVIDWVSRQPVKSESGGSPPRPRRKLTARARLAARQTRVQDFHQSTGFSNSVLATADRRFDEVLVVDDSEVARRYLEKRLQHLGFTVYTAGSGEQALPLLGQRPFEFVFLDVSMEGVDGFELCRHLRKHPLRGYQRPVVIMVTGRTSAVDRIRGTLAGCDAFMSKPASESDLVRTLARFDDSFQRTFEDTAPPWDAA